MARWPILKLIEHLRHSAAKSTTEQMSDVRLIQRFAADRDEAAFEVLVQRYGPMVFGVCLRVLGDAHDAEDAFQATFLVLAKKARSLARQELVGNWLWGVAYRTAKRAQADLARWHARERQVRMAMEADPVEEVMYRELRSVLDEEIKRLPTKYRQPFVLCYLEGKTNEEAARKLGCPTGTVFTRLAQARELLRSRLTRRGVKLSSATLAAALTREVTASVPMGLVCSTVKAAALFAAGNIAVAGVISTRAVTLAEGGLRAMFISKIKVATAVVLTTVTLGSASTLYGYRMLTDGNRKEDPEGKRLVAIVEKEPPNALMANQEFEHSNKASLSKTKDGEVDADSLDLQAADDDNNGGFGFGFGSGSGFGSGQGMGFGMGSSSGGSKLSTLSQKPVQPRSKASGSERSGSSNSGGMPWTTRRWRKT